MLGLANFFCHKPEMGEGFTAGIEKKLFKSNIFGQITNYKKNISERNSNTVFPEVDFKSTKLIKIRQEGLQIKYKFNPFWKSNAYSILPT